jgi:hypothetical protein
MREIFTPMEAAALTGVNRQTLGTWRDRKQFLLLGEVMTDFRLAAEATLGVDLGARTRNGLPWVIEDILRLKLVKTVESMGYSSAIALRLLWHPWALEPSHAVFYRDSVTMRPAMWCPPASSAATFAASHSPALLVELGPLREGLRRAVAERFPTEQEEGMITVEARRDGEMVALVVNGKTILTSPENASTLAAQLQAAADAIVLRPAERETETA